MKTIGICIAAILLLLPAGAIAAGKAQGRELDMGKVEELVHRLVPDVTVESVLTSPVPGLYEVVINSPDSSKGVLYLSVDMKHIVAGSILDMDRSVNLTEKRHMDLNRIDVSGIPLEDALVLGRDGAEHSVIVFDDPD